MRTSETTAIALSNRIQRITVSATLAVLNEAEKYRALGVDLADFGPGEPDFPTPEHIKQAAIQALAENRTKYTPTAGIAPLREGICAWHAQQFGTGFESAECAASVGGKHAIFNAISTLINEGDEVLIPAPYWVSYPDIVKYAGGKPVIVPTGASDHFCLRASSVAPYVTSRAKILIINSPNNPTGAVVPPDEFARLLELCRQKNLWLLSDECYSHFVYGDANPFSVASLPGAKEHVIIAGSFSKTFAMTGWRLGYSLAPKELTQAMVKLASQSTSNPTSIAQYAGIAAMRGPMDGVRAMLAEYARRRRRILDGVRAIQGISCTEPAGAFYVFPNVAAHLSNGTGSSANATELARRLLEEAHVVVVPGDAFGAPGYLRLSYAASMERIEEGLSRLARFFGRTS